MAFNYVGQRNNSGSRNLVPVLLYNSLTFEVGDAIKCYVEGYGQNAAAAVPLKGIIHALVEGTNAKLPPVKGTHTAGSANTSDTTSVTTAADNTTTGKYWALVDTATTSLYSAEVNGTLGTTTNSNLVGGRVDVDSSGGDYGQVLESTHTRTIGTPANFYNHGTDPNDSTRLIVSIAMSEEYGVQE